MKSVLAFTTAALVASSLLAAPAFAQADASGNAAGGIGAGGGVGIGAGGDNGIGVGVSGGVGFGGSGNAAGGAAPGVGHGAGGVNAGVTAGADASATAASGANFGDAVSSIRSSAKAAADFSAVTDAAQVEVVSLDTIAKGENEVAIENAVADNAKAVSDLQTALAGNTAITGALAEKGIPLDAVVAASLKADGGVTVYAR